MSQLQDLTRSLLAAGGAAHPEGKGAYFLYSERASLISKHWTGSAFGDGELITDNVRSDSTAAYLISPSSRLVVCISSSSTLRLLRYDEDDEEWVDDDKFPQLSVHRDGNLSADIDEDGQISVFFQDASGHLVAFGDGELITDNVRSDSTAAYLISPSSRLVVCISSSSTLRLLRYDEDDEEWVDDDKFPQLSVHRDGNLSADIDEDGQISVFFQDASGHLVYVNTAGAPIVLPANPVAGSPISALRTGGEPAAFYVSAKDSHLHYITQSRSGTWTDQSLMDLTIEDRLRQIMVGGSEKSGPEIFALTEDRKLLQYVMGGEGQRRELGKVDQAGKYVPGTTAEFCVDLRVKIFCHTFNWHICSEHGHIRDCCCCGFWEHNAK
ncbi:hypothetical protein WOLCODRAFT_148019 [Wolfiporia cocos MD-104 SS10]|uniref:Fucose-specific lectin n=1 Tax=Wolfiporia cocos (strain MD-104) TaxID=742152 RepID=A0A2H3JBA7_WOLCO|nr:hypothetical protein WOLCODRAFT_148019 [Wolfiporia cocos MD-104 SS10]